MDSNQTADTAIPASDVEKLELFNMVSIPVLSVMLFLYARFLYKSPNARTDPYQLFTLSACIVALSCKAAKRLKPIS